MADWYSTLDGLKLSDPATIAEYTEGIADPDNLPLWRRANSYRCPRGSEPGRAWVLLNRKDFRQGIEDKSGFHTLKFRSPFGGAEFPGLVIVKATSMAGLSSDLKSPLLIELADRRLINQRSTIDARYNVRIPAPPNCPPAAANDYYPQSLDGGSPYTWQTMVDDIVTNVTQWSGDATIPNAPSSTPEGWRFECVNAWDALHAVLDYIGCTTAYDPVADSISIVRRGDEQAAIVQVEAAAKNRLRHDYAPETDLAYGNIPAQVVVCFPKRYECTGVERDTPRADNWEMLDHVHVETANTGITNAVGKCVVNGDLSAMMGCDDAVTNTAALAARAAEIAADYARNWDTKYGRMYAGIVTALKPGSRITLVTYRDYGDEVGLVTEFTASKAAGPCNQREDVDGCCRAAGDEYERLRPPDLSRKTHPTTYPRELQLVQVVTGGSAGDCVQANACGLFAGKVIRYCSTDGPEVLEDCWIKIVNCDDGFTGDVAVREGGYHLGRLSGCEDCAGCELPVYLAVPSAEPVLVRLTSCLEPGGTATAVIQDGDGDGGCDSLTLHDSAERNFLVPCEKVFAFFDCASGQWEVLGENGLFRHGKATEDIDCDSSGEVAPYCEQNLCPGSGAPTADCEGAASSCTVTACNEWGSTRKIFSDEEVFIRFDACQKQWYILPFPRNRMWSATLASDLCSGGSASLTTPRTALDVCNDDTIFPPPTTATNPYNHCASAGDLIKVQWDETNQNWFVADVVKKDLCPVLDVYTCGDTDGIAKAQMRICAEYCDADIPTEGCLVIGIRACPSGSGSGSGSGAECDGCDDLSWTFTTTCCQDE